MDFVRIFIGSASTSFEFLKVLQNCKYWDLNMSPRNSMLLSCYHFN